MQLRRSLLLICAESTLLVYASAASAISLIPMDEPVTQLVSPSPSIPQMQYAQVGTEYISQPVTSTPLLCGNTSTPLSNFSAVSPVYYSPNGLINVKPFIFGASSADPTTPAAALGGAVTYGGSAMQLQLGDPSLVCYSLDANGVHGPTAGVLRDQFQGANFSPTIKQSFNSSVVLTVFHVPANSTDFYGYTIDVTLPATPAGVTCGPTAADCNFALLEGFDTSVFATNSKATHADEGWCIGSPGSTQCSTNSIEGGINVNYATWTANPFLPQLTTGAPTVRFVVKRYFASGVAALPADGGPVAIAALFSPFDLDENFVGDNVAVGYGNTPPAVVQSGDAWTVFSSHLAAQTEGTNSGALAFNVSDSDTTGAITAAVTLNLGPLTVPVTPTCSAISGTGQSNAQCSFSIDFSNAAWWDSSVGAAFQGQGNVFATDPGGVGATVNIVVTDALGKSSASLSVPLKVNSSVNNAPLVSFGGALPKLADPLANNILVPTYTCSISGNSCGRFVDLAGALSATPGPAAAFDELASQSTAVVAYTGAGANGGNVQCTAEQGSIFLTSGSPLVQAGAQAGSYDLNFLPASPLTAGSALCTVVITDTAASFPVPQTAKTTSAQFRIVAQ